MLSGVFFWKRYFSSYIKKVTCSDRPINSYKNEIEALFEPEDIKKEIFINEHYMWNY